MPAEQLLDAIDAVSGVPGNFAGVPVGTRASELPSPEMGGHFLRIFGQPGRETVCDCERGKEPKLSQPLTLMSGTLLSARLRDPRSRLAKHLAQVTDPAAVAAADRKYLSELYFAAFSRAAVEEELAYAMQHLQTVGDRAAGLEDVSWAVLNSKEFLFQH